MSATDPSSGEKAVPWDRRLTERLAREAWVAANDPTQRLEEPPLREQVRTRWFWLRQLPYAAVIAALIFTDIHGALWGVVVPVVYLGWMWLVAVLERRTRRRAETIAGR